MAQPDGGGSRSSGSYSSPSPQVYYDEQVAAGGTPFTPPPPSEYYDRGLGGAPQAMPYQTPGTHEYQAQLDYAAIGQLPPVSSAGYPDPSYGYGPPPQPAYIPTQVSYTPPPPPPRSEMSQAVGNATGGLVGGYGGNADFFQKMSDASIRGIQRASDELFNMFLAAGSYGQAINPADLSPGTGSGGGARGFMLADPVQTTWEGMMQSPYRWTGYDSEGRQLPDTTGGGNWRQAVPSWDESTPTEGRPTPAGQIGGDWSPAGTSLTWIEQGRTFPKDSNRYDNPPMAPIGPPIPAVIPRPGVPVPPGGVPMPAPDGSPAGQYTFPDYNPIQQPSQKDDRGGPGYIPPPGLPIPPGGVPPVTVAPPPPGFIPPPGLPIPPGGVPMVPLPVPPIPQESAPPAPAPYTFPDYNPIPPAPGAPSAPAAPAPGPVGGPAQAAPAAPAPAAQQTPLITPDGTVYGVLTTNANGQTVVRKLPPNKPNRWNIPQLENTGIRRGVVGMLQGANVGPNLPPGITQTVPPGFALPPGFLLPRWAEKDPLPPTFQETVRRQNEQQMAGREPNRNKLRRR